MACQPVLLENDRQKTLEMVDAGISVADVAARFNVHKSAV